MTVSFVGAASAAASTLTLPAHRAGDIIVAAAWNPGTMPTLPSGWRFEFAVSSFSQRMIVATKTCASASETFGTWTSGVNVGAIILRSSNSTLHSGTGTGGAGSGLTVTYPSIGNRISFANKWAVAFGNYTTTDTTIETAPTGLTFRSGVVGTAEMAVFDSNANLDWSTLQTVTISGTSGIFCVAVIEIFETGYSPAAGMLIHPGMNGGMRG